uniref:Uncharacterized protein n=1 Tax=Marseillevirus LCMAC102 TaxID=2506603 RepID=A0A481YSS6_9VIRU|nr:MAG: hypothetical protein LCMAC102_00870 [Marseillevirus LCMAC102]
MTHTIGQNIVDILFLCASLFQIALMHLAMKKSSFPPDILIHPDIFMSRRALALYNIGYGIMSANVLLFSKYPMREYIMILNLVGLWLFYAEFKRSRNRRQLANEYQTLQNIQVIPNE